MEKIELEILALANSEAQPNSFVVILKEKEGNRRLPVVIGGFEAQAIALAIQGIKPNRPLTHDLFRDSLTALDITLLEVTISALKEGIFYALLAYNKPDGTVVEVDSRTSDAIALAVRFSCPIYAYANILDEAAIAVENDENMELLPSGAALSDYSKADLEQMLSEALANENYERAAEIRDEIKNREGKN